MVVGSNFKTFPPSCSNCSFVVSVIPRGKLNLEASIPRSILTKLRVTISSCSTGEKEMAAELEELYGDIDALEFYPGLMLEKCQPNSIFGESMIEMGAPFSLKGLLGNPICSPEYWKPSTFGGDVGFNIVNTASLKKLVCLNTKTCPYVSFRVPDYPGDDGSVFVRPSTEL